MSCNSDVSEGVRLGWACDVLNAYQRVVGEAIDGDPTSIASISTHLHSALPTPGNRAEWIHLLQSLSPFLDRVGHVLHAAYHQRFPTGSCPAVPPGSSTSTGFDLEAAVRAIPVTWASEYEAWFYRHHTLPGALRTKALLETAFAEPLTLSRIAVFVGCSRTTLIDQFTAAFGLPPAEYLARVRMREGLRRLRGLSDTIENAAAEVGYRSGNKFYSRMRRYADVTPSEVRRMTESEFDQLLEERMSVRRQLREDRQISTPVSTASAADRRRANSRSSVMDRRLTDRRTLAD